MNKTELKEKINNELKSKFDFVEDTMIFPDEYANLNGDFPYVTIVFSSWKPQTTALYGKQGISIIGITQGDKDTISHRVDSVEAKILEVITKSEIKMNILEIDNNSLFTPFGLDAGLRLPYGGVRFECEVSNVRAI